MNKLGRFVQRILDRIKTENRLAILSSDAAADIGSTPAELIASSRLKVDVPERMGRMATTFGATKAFAQADRYRVLDMARICDRCGARRVCNHTLFGDATSSGAEPTKFCPNAANYHDLVAAQH